MAEVFADRVAETSTTTGTGTLNLAGALTGFRTFVAGIGDGNTCIYLIVNTADASEWEVGIGTVTDATPDTLSRDSVESSSNAGSAVDFSAGTKRVLCVLSATQITEFVNNLPIDGTYTVTATPATSGSVTLDSTRDVAAYTKIGRAVHVQGTLLVDSVSSPVGDIQFSLPYEVANLDETSGRAFGVIWMSGVDYTADYLIAYAEEGTQYFLISEVIDNSAADYYDGNDVAAGDSIGFQITYFAA